MPRTLEEIRNDVRQLPFEQRMQLMEEIRDSVMTAEEREVEQAWLEEAERRMREIDNGTAKSIPGDEVLRKLREKYGAGRTHESQL